MGPYSTFLGQALDELGITRVHLVLHDFGGPFGLVGCSTPTGASTVLFNIGLLPGYSWHKSCAHLAHAAARRAVHGDREPLAPSAR